MSLRNLRILAVVAVVAGLALPGCKGGDDGGFTLNPTSENICGELAKVACQLMFDCCTGKQLEDALGVSITQDEKTCRRDLELVCQGDNAVFSYGVTHGTTALKDPEGTKACLDAILARGECVETTGELPFGEACRNFGVVGLQKSGEDCIWDLECADGGYCGVDHKCKALPAQWERCALNLDTPCAKGLYCDSEQRCAAFKLLGNPCADSYECSADLYCAIEEGAEAGVCTRLKDVDEFCGSQDECLSGYCIPGVCSDSGEECFLSKDCGGTCAGTEDTCWDAADCGGTCSISGETCWSQEDCYGEGEICNMRTCDFQTCIGSPVCGEHLFQIDYCEIGMNLSGNISDQ